MKYLINLWLPSMCHSEFGPLTLYALLVVAWADLRATPSGSTLRMLALTLPLGTCKPRKLYHLLIKVSPCYIRDDTLEELQKSKEKEG